MLVKIRCKDYATLKCVSYSNNQESFDNARSALQVTCLITDQLERVIKLIKCLL